MQDRPVCFWCDKRIETNAEMVFEAPCGHDHHSSAVFHGICLFSWRDRRAEFEGWLQQVRQRWLDEHGQHEEEAS